MLNARNVAREPPAETWLEPILFDWRLLDRAAPTGCRGSWLPSIDLNDRTPTTRTDRATSAGDAAERRTSVRRALAYESIRIFGVENLYIHIARIIRNIKKFH